MKKITIYEFWRSPYKIKNRYDSLSLEEWIGCRSLREWLFHYCSHRFCLTNRDKKTFASGRTFLILAPHIIKVNINESKKCHDANLVIWVSTPSNNFIICGDASDTELKKIRNDWKLSYSIVVRASHHGSRNSSNL